MRYRGATAMVLINLDVIGASVLPAMLSLGLMPLTMLGRMMGLEVGAGHTADRRHARVVDRMGEPGRHADHSHYTVMLFNMLKCCG